MSLYGIGDDTEKLLASPKSSSPSHTRAESPPPSRRSSRSLSWKRHFGRSASGASGPSDHPDARGRSSFNWRGSDRHRHAHAQAWRRWLYQLQEWDLTRLLGLVKRHARLLSFLTVLTALLLSLLIYCLLPGPHPPFPWRDQCRASFPVQYALSPSLVGAQALVPLKPDHPAWPSAYPPDRLPVRADAKAAEAVKVFIGIFTVARAWSRRQLIRETYRRQGVPGVKWVFVLGRAHGKDVEEEAALYGDMVFLDIHENMNDGKTCTFFRWAGENASMRPTSRPSVVVDERDRPDYVMKADDDSFIMLDELEMRLRIIPRTMAYWGLLMFGEYKQSQRQGEYMTGGGYALSFDLVQHIAADPYSRAHMVGHEDQRVGDWIRAHPLAEKVVWVTERCWMYDHPRATGWALSHGFLFPNVVSRIRDQTERLVSHIPPSLPVELERSWSSVTAWLVPYRSPVSPREMTVEQRTEAMIEGSPLSLLHSHNRAYMASNTTSFPPGGASREWDERHGREEATAQEVQLAWSERLTRGERMRGREEIGSTVLVHEVKKDAWWIETALVLMGPEGWNT